MFNIFILSEVGLNGLPVQLIIILLVMLFFVLVFSFIRKENRANTLEFGENTHASFLKSIMDHSGSGNAILDADGFIRYVNFGFEALFSDDQLPLVGKNINHIPRLQKLNRSFSKENSSVVKILGSEGETYMMKYFTVRNKEQEVIGHYLKMLPDIHTGDETADLDLSHELKTPLHAVLGFSDLLRKDSHLTSAQEQLLEKIIYHSRLLDNKIKSLVGSQEVKHWRKTEIPGSKPVQKILVVDDVSINRTLLKLMLRRQMLDVREASNGEAALKILENWSADMILMDLSMPVLDGIETVKIIRKNGLSPSSKIIAVTATQRYSRDELLEMGFDDLMHKPFKEEELLNFIGIQQDSETSN